MEKYLDRAVSWIEFNERILFEAKNNNPLLEKVRFLSISVLNLEEFYIVHYKKWKSLIGRGSNNLLNIKINRLLSSQHRIWISLKNELASNNIHICEIDELEEGDYGYIQDYFTNCAIQETGQRKFAKFVLISKETNSFVIYPIGMNELIKISGKNRFISVYFAYQKIMENILLPSSPLFEIAYVIRDTDSMQVSCVYIKRTSAKQIQDFIISEFGIASEDLIYVDAFITNISKIVDTNDLASLKYPKSLPYQHHDMSFIIFPKQSQLLFDTEFCRNFIQDLFFSIKQHDIIIQHPYSGFQLVQDFIESASLDPDVLSIKYIIYRVGDNSPIIKSLINAAKLGKEVLVIIEIRARFNEEDNIKYAETLKYHGIKVFLGMDQYKVHSKLSLISRMEYGEIKLYAHYGTGNYNHITSTTYQDLSLFTADQDLCKDAENLIDCIIGKKINWSFRKLITSPYFMRRKLIELIYRESDLARAGKYGHIWIKNNAVVDREIIDSFYHASCSGVKIDMIVRGMCSVIPGIKGMSENIRVKSIVGRFLEHSRIYCFGLGNQLPCENAEVYIASADIMERNLDKRVEIMLKVENQDIKRYILHYVMETNFKDDVNSWTLNSDGSYSKIPSNNFSAYQYFMSHQELEN